MARHRLPLALSVGPQGPAGAQGAAGPQGSPGLSDLQRVSSQSGINSDSPKSVKAVCPSGRRAIAGGGDVPVPHSPSNLQTLPITVSSSVPGSDGASWSVQAFETAPDSDSSLLEAWVVCAKVGG